MSKPRRVPDAERTATMMDLLHRRFAGIGQGGASRSHVVVEECAPGTGFSSGVQRWADALVLSVWPSNGLTLDGYEVKASKSDLKKELSDLSKHQALARYCDRWWLLVWDESILVDGIPESWGIVVTVDSEYGRELKVKRQAEKRTPEPWPRSFVCAMVRNASEQAPGAAYVARACVQANAMGRSDGQAIERGNTKHAMRPLAEVLYGKNDWKWPKEAFHPESLIKIAAERLQQPVLGVEASA